MAIRFIDLFAGIGGFHSVGDVFGWECVFASEIDDAAARIYKRNWDLKPHGDIKDFTRGRNKKNIPNHDVLFAGFPCQPFSKSGKQLGMNEDRGSLFHDILRVLSQKKPSIFVLENVRNLSGPRHKHEWEFIISNLRKIGYRVSDEPFVVSPHRIPSSQGGAPQARERVFIAGTLTNGRNRNKESTEGLKLPVNFEFWDESNWDIYRDLPIEKNTREIFMKYRISQQELEILNAWDALIRDLWEVSDVAKLPGFPLWSDIWGKKPIYVYEKDAPEWKLKFEQKNRNFYSENKKIIDSWLKNYKVVRESVPSKRKFEWQAQKLPTIWDGLIHFRPSGVRVKRATYVPALVAITQTTILGKYKRRLTPREAARLQGLSDNFDFFGQNDAETYKQLGNGVSVGAVYNVIKALIERDKDLLSITNPNLIKSVLKNSFYKTDENKKLLKSGTKSKVL